MNKIHGNVPVAGGRGVGKMLSCDYRAFRLMWLKRRRLAKTGRAACSSAGERMA